jgi:hypothetical protein
MKKTLFQSIHLFYAQVFLSLIGLSMLVWKAGDIVKVRLLSGTSYGMKEWTLLFYHPYEANLMNYMLFAVVIGFFALVAYCLPLEYLKKAGAAAGSVRKRTAFYLLGISLAIVISYVLPFRTDKYFIPVFFLTLSPLGYFVPEAWFKRSLLPAALLLFLFTALEPARLFLGPAKLMNDYPEILSETVVDKGYVRKDIFKPGLTPDPNNPQVRKYFADNFFEFSHQIMGRGQLNHVGHMLNTANEYSLGKPLPSIFMQYGLGNMLLFKWTMDLFGGVSFQNYYKCYIYYPVYYFLFLLMLYLVFKDGLYVFLGFSAVVVMFFFYNYVPFFFAPGLVPTIHFFDVFLVVSMLAFFNGRSERVYLAASFIAVALGILMNRQFGAMLALAWIVTLAVYAFENCGGGKRYLWLTLPAVLLSPVLLFASGFSGAASEGLLRTFFSGLYSWPPPVSFIQFTIIYFVVSYGFLFLIKASRSHLKYLYLLSFVYSQCLFVYFYWAGMPNHFPIVIPFIVFQFLLAMKIVEGMESSPFIEKAVYALKPMLVLIAVYSVAAYASGFYSSPLGKGTVSANFVTHRTFDWKFKNAELISTINPVIFEDAAKLINKYADNRGIYIISKFDAILPFVSGRYSMLPHFELSWFVIDDAKCEQVIKIFKEGAPHYIFVDTDLNSSAVDPVARFDAGRAASERISRRGRIKELNNIFQEVSRGYKLVEKGGLVSVYEKVR